MMWVENYTVLIFLDRIPVYPTVFTWKLLSPCSCHLKLFFAHAPPASWGGHSDCFIFCAHRECRLHFTPLDFSVLSHQHLVSLTSLFCTVRGIFRGSEERKRGRRTMIRDFWKGEWGIRDYTLWKFAWHSLTVPDSFSTWLLYDWTVN